MSLLRFTVVASAVLTWAVGCASAAHPAPAGDAEGDADERSATEETGLAAGTTVTCVPFSSRTCRNYYTTADGHHHCPESLEICQADGLRYGACGDLSIGPGDSGTTE